MPEESIQTKRKKADGIKDIVVHKDIKPITQCNRESNIPPTSSDDSSPLIIDDQSTIFNEAEQTIMSKDDQLFIQKDDTSQIIEKHTVKDKGKLPLKVIQQSSRSKLFVREKEADKMLQSFIMKNTNLSNTDSRNSCFLD